MADQFSFDVVSQVDLQEVKNAVEHTTKEVRQRFPKEGEIRGILTGNKPAVLS